MKMLLYCRLCVPVYPSVFFLPPLVCSHSKVKLF